MSKPANPFRNPGSRAGIQDPRSSTYITNLADIEAAKSSRPKPLSAHTNILRIEDLEEMSAEAPAAEPLGQAPEPTSVASRMVAIFAAKGGVGATTLAVNVAGTLCKLSRKVVVVDMDFQLGSVPVSLNLKPQRSIAELVLEAEELGVGPLESGLDRHPMGLTMVSQGDRIEELSTITPARLPRFFDALGSGFEVVVADGLKDFSDHAVATMDLAHKVVLVVTQDVPAVRAAARALRLFRRLGYGPDRIEIVINRYHKKAPVTLDAIHNALGQPVNAVVRNDFPLVEQALNHGVMVSDIKPGAGLTKDIDALARHLGGIAGEARSGGGLFARLFKRG